MISSTGLILKQRGANMVNPRTVPDFYPEKQVLFSLKLALQKCTLSNRDHGAGLAMLYNSL